MTNLFCDVVMIVVPHCLIVHLDYDCLIILIHVMVDSRLMLVILVLLECSCFIGFFMFKYRVFYRLWFLSYLQVPTVFIPLVVLFGSSIQVPVNKCWPHLFSFTAKCKGSICSGDVRFRWKLQIHDFGVIRLLLIDSCFLFWVVLAECFYSHLSLFGF